MIKHLFLISFLSFLIIANAQEKKYAIWNFETNDRIFSHPIKNGNTVYFGSNDKNFYAIDATTREKLWNFKTDHKIQSSAIVHDKIVYFKSGNDIYALNKKTGKELWNCKNTNKKDSEKLDPWDYHHGAPVINNSIIYFGLADGKLCGFDLKTGNLKMQYTAIDSAAIRCTPAIQNNFLYFGDWKGKIYAYDLSSNDTLWTYQTYKKQLYPTFGQINTELVIYDTLLVFGARNPEMQILNINTGKPVWNYIDKNGGWISGDPIVVSDTLYIGGSDNHKLIAFDIHTGKKLWEYEFLFNSFSKPLIYKDYILFTTGDAYSVFGTGSGHGYLYALNRNNGTIKNFALIGGNVYSSPVIYNNNIFLSSEDNHLYAIDLKSFISNAPELIKIGYKSVDILKISPNPFKDSIRVNYKVHYETNISAKITDINGKETKNLYLGKKAKGEHSIIWNGKDNSGKIVPKGYYFFEISSGQFYKNSIIQKSE